MIYHLFNVIIWIYVYCQNAQSDQQKLKDKKTVDITKERDQLCSQLSERDEQLDTTRSILRRTESERDELLRSSKVHLHHGIKKSYGG